MNSNRVKGIVNELVGLAKRKTGKATGNTRLQVECVANVRMRAARWDRCHSLIVNTCRMLPTLASRARCNSVAFTQGPANVSRTEVVF